MHRGSVVFAIMLATEALFSQGISPTAAPATSALVLSIRSDHPTCRITDNIELQTQISNYTNHDIYIWNWDFGWTFANSLSLQITAADGSRVPVKLLRDDPPPPPPRAGHPEQFIRIQASSFYGTIATFSVHDLISKPGEYDFVVAQESSFPAHWLYEQLKDDPIAKLPLRMKEDPVLTSNKLHISIKP
jgi:hypothetical protein